MLYGWAAFIHSWTSWVLWDMLCMVRGWKVHWNVYLPGALLNTSWLAEVSKDICWSTVLFCKCRVQHILWCIMLRVIYFRPCDVTDIMPWLQQYPNYTIICCCYCIPVLYKVNVSLLAKPDISPTSIYDFSNVGVFTYAHGIFLYSSLCRFKWCITCPCTNFFQFIFSSERLFRTRKFKAF